MGWDFETEPEYQEKLDWVDRFLREDVEPLDYVLGDAYDKTDQRALAVVRPRGQVVLLGMPEPFRVDLTPLWHREVALLGAYAYGSEAPAAGRAATRTFALAFELVADAGLGRLVSATYPLERYREAIEHAAAAGRRGGVKVAFDLRATKAASA